MCYCSIVWDLDNIKLQIDEIRKFRGYESLTDEQANMLADFLSMYAIITFGQLTKYGSS